MKKALLGSFAACLTFTLWLAGCGSSDKCAGTKCLTGQTCNSTTGHCEANPGGGGG